MRPHASHQDGGLRCGDLLVAGQPRAQRGPGLGDWPHHGGDAGSTKYSALDLITPANVGIAARRLAPAGGRSGVAGGQSELVVPANFRATPLKAGGLLYASNALGIAEAFDPATGRTVWAQAVAADDLGGAGASRNLAYWSGAGRRPRVQRARPLSVRRRCAHRRRR